MYIYVHTYVYICIVASTCTCKCLHIRIYSYVLVYVNIHALQPSRRAICAFATRTHTESMQHKDAYTYTEAEWKDRYSAALFHALAMCWSWSMRARVEWCMLDWEQQTSVESGTQGEANVVFQRQVQHCSGPVARRLQRLQTQHCPMSLTSTRVRIHEHAGVCVYIRTYSMGVYICVDTNTRARTPARANAAHAQQRKKQTWRRV